MLTSPHIACGINAITQVNQSCPMPNPMVVGNTRQRDPRKRQAHQQRAHGNFFGKKQAKGGQHQGTNNTRSEKQQV